MIVAPAPLVVVVVAAAAIVPSALADPLAATRLLPPPALAALAAAHAAPVAALSLRLVLRVMIAADHRMSTGQKPRLRKTAQCLSLKALPKGMHAHPAAIIRGRLARRGMNKELMIGAGSGTPDPRRREHGGVLSTCSCSFFFTHFT